MTDATLIVLAKAPVPGRVKTRLCPPCTPAEAAEIAHASLVATLAAAVDTPGVDPIVVLDGEPGSWMPAGVPVVPQCGGGLADRLAGAFGSTTGPTVLVGMDTPQITATRLRAVVDTLLTPGTDAALGLTEDGGWWTIGLRDPRVPAFLDVPMSTPETGRRQLERLRALDLAIAMVEPAIDVDTIDSARAVAAEIPGSEFARVVHRVAPAEIAESST